MPRACVIVLDAVGAGALPDAEDYGDEGSDTLGNVARAVGGLDLPSLEALGLGNVESLEGCRPQPGAPALAGRLVERSKGKDTTTGKWIVYTSADSVFQVAAHEDTVPLEELYDACRIARDEVLVGKHAVGRVIARPFVGDPGNYVRTPNRHDFSLEPKRPNYLTLVRDTGLEVHGVGKISDI